MFLIGLDKEKGERMTAWEITKKSYKEIYQNIAAILTASILWFLIAGIVILANFIALNAILIGKPVWILPFLFLALLTVGPATAGAFYVSNIVVRYGNLSISDFFIGLKEYFFKSIFLTSAFALVAGILCFDFTFFLSSDTLWMKLSSLIWLSGLIFSSIVFIYSFTLMIELDRLDESNSIKDIIKYSAVLSIKEFKFTLFIYLQILIYLVWSVGLVITLPTIFMGGISLIANNATLNLLVKHNVIDDVSGPKTFKEQ
ncbi:MAG: hypothetical protein R6V17_06480 [Halanaerobacter sp.]